MKSLHLTIDSRDAKKTQVILAGIDFTDVLINEEVTAHSQVILPYIEEALKKHACALSDIADITVLVDRGSFTGRRVGVVIAKMLGFLLAIPVNGVPAETPIDIPYEEDKWK